MIVTDPVPSSSTTPLSKAARLIRSWGGVPIIFFVCLVLAVSWEAHALFSPVVRIRAIGQKPFVVTDFGRGVPVAQTFRMLSDGLDAVDVRLFSDEETLLVLRCQLLGWNEHSLDHWFPLYDWRASVRLPRGASWHRFSFTPVVPSFNRIYQFQVEQLDARPARLNGAGESLRPSVGIMGSIDDSLKEGNIILGRTQVTERDLFFEAHAADSAFDEFGRHARTQLPKPLRSAAVQLTLLAIYNSFLAVFAFHMLIPSSRDADGS